MGTKNCVGFLERPKKVGAEEEHLTGVRFAEELEAHSKEEEEVLYPPARLNELATKAEPPRTVMRMPA